MSTTLKAILTSLLMQTSRSASGGVTSANTAHGTSDGAVSRRPGRWQRWRTRRRLEELSDHELRDVGLTRAEARREARAAFWR